MDAKDIVMIDNYKTLPLGKYQEILSICKRTSLDESEREVMILSILTGMDENVIWDLPIMEFKSLTSRLGFLESPLTFDEKIADAYVLGKYKLIPVTDFRKITTAQYVDFQTFHQGDGDKDFAKILSCLMVPEGYKYNRDYDIIEVQHELRDSLNVHDAFTLYGFFLRASVESIKDMLTYSMSEAQRIKDQQQRERVITEIQTAMKMITETLSQSVGGGLPQ